MLPAKFLGQNIRWDWSDITQQIFTWSIIGLIAFMAHSAITKARQ